MLAALPSHPVMRVVRSVVLLLGLVALLTVHGLDATATAAHGERPASGVHAAASDGGAGHDPSGQRTAAGVRETGGAVDRGSGVRDRDLHHLAAACVAALLAAAAVGFHRRLAGMASTLRHDPAGLPVTLRRRTQLLPHPPPAAWLRLCIILR